MDDERELGGVVLVVVCSSTLSSHHKCAWRKKRGLRGLLNVRQFSMDTPSPLLTAR